VQLNSELGNKSAEDKFALMRGKLAKRITEFPALVSMVEKYDADPFLWDDKVIGARALELAEQSYQKVWPL